MILTVIVILLILLASGLPVAFALGLSGAVGLYMVGGLSMLLGMLSSAPGSAITNYELLTIPMFLLMAEFMVASRIANSLFDAIACWTIRLRGGLGIATAITGAAFGAISGSSTAAAATLSSTSVPSMIRHGYEPRFASGIVAISGTLAMIIPPSIAIIFYGLLSGVSIAELLIAGVVPGILITLTIILTIRFLIWRNPTLAGAGGTSTLKEKIASLRTAGPFVTLFLLVTGLIYTGITTPVESSAIGAAGAMLVTLIRGQLTYSVLKEVVVKTCVTSAMIGFIIVCAQLLSFFVTLTGVTQGIIGYINAVGMSPYAVLAVLVVVYIVLGCFLDQISILILTVPIVLPLTTSLGFDPIWFGILIIVLAEIGLVTPPIGLNLFVVASATGQSIQSVTYGAAPHVVAHLLLVGFLIAFPEVVLWLPSTMK